MSGKEKKQQRIYDLLYDEPKPKFLCLSNVYQRIRSVYNKWDRRVWLNCYRTVSNVTSDNLILQIKNSTINFCIGQVGWVFANGPGDLDSIPGRVMPKTLKMVLDTSLLSTQQYKVRIEDKVEQSRERSGGLPYTSVY